MRPNEPEISLMKLTKCVQPNRKPSQITNKTFFKTKVCVGLVKSSHIYLYSAFHNTDCIKAASQPMCLVIYPVQYVMSCAQNK